jgi:hypothetical protein
LDEGGLGATAALIHAVRPEPLDEYRSGPEFALTGSDVSVVMAF